MPISTTHPNPEVDTETEIIDIDTLENSPSQQKLTELIDKLGSTCEPSESFNLLLDIENEEDGRITKLMNVYYKHLNSLL